MALSNVHGRLYLVVLSHIGCMAAYCQENCCHGAQRSGCAVVGCLHENSQRRRRHQKAHRLHNSSDTRDQFSAGRAVRHTSTRQSAAPLRPLERRYSVSEMEMVECSRDCLIKCYKAVHDFRHLFCDRPENNKAC